MSSRNYFLHSLADAFGIQRWLSKIEARVTLTVDIEDVNVTLDAKGISKLRQPCLGNAKAS
jgi:hypothetical protein